MITVNIQFTGGISQGWGVTRLICVCWIYVVPEAGRERQNHPQWLSQQLSFTSSGTWTQQPSPSAALSLTWLGMDTPTGPLPCAARTIPLWIPLWILLWFYTQSQGSLHFRLCHGAAGVPSCQHSITQCCSTSPDLDQPQKTFSGLVPVAAAMANLARHSLAL